MEMRTQHPSKRGSMEDEEDRLSTLPDDLLHAILRDLPLKHAVRTSALSRRWAPQWLRALAASRVLDFTDPDLTRSQQQPARWAAATVRRCLDLHAEHGAGAPLAALRVALVSPPAGPSFAAFQRDVVGWIASAVASGATEVAVDLTPTPTPPPSWGSATRDADHERAAFVELPGDLFAARNSLSRLALGGFSLRAIPVPGPAAAGLAGLRSLSLSYCHPDFTGDAIRDVVSGLPALEHLRLSSCHRLESIRIASETLRVLEVVRCSAVQEVRVTAPALESVAFHDDVFFWDNADDVVFRFDGAGGGMPALRDVFLSQVSFGHDSDETYYDSLLRDVANAPVWTLSSHGYNLMFRFDTTNIRELQLLMATVDDFDYLEGLAGFFQENELPLLNRLFVRFPGHVTDASDADAAAALAGEAVDDSELEIGNEFVLGSLSFIKLVNFRGTMFELQLLAFVLKRAPALEHLVLVTVGEEEGGTPGPGDEHLEVIRRQVSAMWKASPHARLTVCRSSQDRSQNPVHARLYDEV